MYLPGRTIIFDDYLHALHHIGVEGYHPKEEGMPLLMKHYESEFESMVFLRHLDVIGACSPVDHNGLPGGHCCEGGSTYRHEIVALKGWNWHACPGHQNLSRLTHRCSCSWEYPHTIAC